MPRKGPVAPRVPEPDMVYGSRLVSRLINNVMRRGKKSVAEHVV
jgi:small subunit ribosomal protein S7